MDRAVRYASTYVQVSVIEQDRFFKDVRGDGNKDWPWDRPESLNDDLVLEVLQAEVDDDGVDCVLFERFKAFHDERVLRLLDVLIWLDVPEHVAEKRRMSRGTGCTHA